MSQGFTVATTTTIIEVAKPSDRYSIMNLEETDTYKYFGFEMITGAWYIMRKTIATDVILYAAGDSDYTTAWTDRVQQTYAAYSAAF